MSFLAPLYIAGMLAVGLPILFHLIRRTPQNRQPFSSLMFLTPSPPRLTRRSRLTNILLLLLRACALILLAIAFARPFFYRHEDLNVSQSQGRRIALLVDTSASMRRADLWDQAKKQVEQATSDLTPSDEVALFFFDRNVRAALTFSEWNELELSRRVPLLRARLSEASPMWASTNLGDALSTVADQLAEAHASQAATDTTRRQIVLISDLQQGAHASALQGREWPENVLLDVRPVTPKQSSNASLQLIHESLDTPAAGDGKLRVRVSNEATSTAEQFSLVWANDRGPIASIGPISVYVAPGRSQIVRIAPPSPEQHVDRLILREDDVDFDNTLYIAATQVEQLRVVYLGDDSPGDAQSLSYYLRSALEGSGTRKLDLIQRKTGDSFGETDLNDARLAVITSALADSRITVLRHYLETGGAVLWVLKDSASSGGLANLLATEPLQVKESSPSDFALLSRVELEHPLFAPFADARFADFTKIHFWKHRSLTFPSTDSTRTLASFDNGDPFLIEKQIGKGALRVMTSSWQPADSQLALSTKFVPLINGFVQRNETTIGSDFVVADAIALPVSEGKRIVRTPDGKSIEIANSAKTFDATSVPGVYHLSINSQDIPLAVNLAVDESRIAPMAPADLEQFGAKLGDKAPPEVLLARQRELKFFELENRQKMWRWLIVVVLGLVAAETVLAGKLARRAAYSTPETSSSAVTT